MQKFEIIDLYLEGFAKIYTGMHIDRIYLNFSEMPHQTYLFVGDSGSGKSSILKSIHPFAFNSGTGDESSGRDLIMNKRDGKKIIRYDINGDVITCTHIYIRKNDESLQVRSFLSVNGEEKNPSGLVTTFTALVSAYFHIDESFLALLALGNSVQSLVEYTSAERKKFAVKIFTELNIYTTYFKNASGVVRELNTILGNVVDKLGRYGNYDKESIRKNISSIKKDISATENDLGIVLQRQGAIKSSLEKDNEMYKEYSASNNTVTELFVTVDRLKAKRKTSSDITVLENNKNQIMRNIMSTELRVESLESSIKAELEFKEVKLSMKANLEDSIKRMENNTDRIELEKLIANIDSELVGLDDIEVLSDIDYVKKKDYLIKANIYLDELRGLCTDLITEVELPDLIPEVFEKFMGNKHYEHELDIAYQAALERISNLQNANHLIGQIEIPKIEPPTDCSVRSCPYKRFYLDSVEILSAKNDKADKILRMERDALKVADTKREIFSILRKLYKYIDKHEVDLKDVPMEIFDPNQFVLTYVRDSNRVVYNMDLMSSSISYLEQAVRKSQLFVLRDSTEKQLNGIETTISLYNSMKEDLEKTVYAIQKTDETLEQYQVDLDYNRNQLTSLTSTVNDLDGEIKIASELEDCRKQIAEAQRKLKDMEDCRDRYEKASKELDDTLVRERDLRDKLSDYREKLNQLEETLRTISSLESEKKMLTEKYSEAVLIRDAVSPTKGIPVEFIDDTIRNQMIDSINELIHVAYPDITLLKEELIINDKEFTIPYRKNGVIIGDISEASDGERAMLSLAFSLVLIRLVSKVYNIMLLDEMDTALDKYGRSKYIDIIEQYMTTIHATQIFLISHNSMFDMYSVNVLQTTKGTVDNIDQKFVVTVYNQNITPDEFNN